MSTTRTLKVDYLARVEGEGALYVRVEGDRVAEARLSIFEPPRFFEAFLRGRHYTEPPDITARICGICPVAYQLAALHALERGAKATIPDVIQGFRRLLLCGEWIESHALHVSMLHVPDFFRLEGVVAMSRVFPEVVHGALRLKKAGNHVMRLLGGREIHPINVRVGGFYRLPTAEQLEATLPSLEQALVDAHDLLSFCSTLEIPGDEVNADTDVPLVALSGDTLSGEAGYPMLGEELVSTDGVRLGPDDFEAGFVESHVERSTALHSEKRVGTRPGPYLVGPMARFALGRERLHPEALRRADALGLEASSRNPFATVLTRSLEIVHAVAEARELTHRLAAHLRRHPHEPPAVDVAIPRGRGAGWVEAPRGLLYHRYDVGEDGLIASCNLVPPTAQNQASIENDLLRVVERSLDQDDDELTWRCEQTIRNYDPCISCSTHFLRVTVDRVRAGQEGTRSR